MSYFYVALERINFDANIERLLLKFGLNSTIPHLSFLQHVMILKRGQDIKENPSEKCRKSNKPIVSLDSLQYRLLIKLEFNF